MNTGNTTTSQLPQRALELRFLTRTQSEVTQLRACLPEDGGVLQPVALEHIERMAQKIGSAATAFGFPEIDAIAGSIELIAHSAPTRPRRERPVIVVQLRERIAVLAAHVHHEREEREAQQVPDAIPMSAHLPGFGLRRK
jgi:HPt (histidine-containing phosphotransfer) domain-containing protein